MADIKLSCRVPYATANVANQRTVIRDVIAEKRWPNCPWCSMRQLQPLADMVIKGVTMKQVETICLCLNCQNATVVRYELPNEAPLPVFGNGTHKAVKIW